MAFITCVIPARISRYFSLRTEVLRETLETDGQEGLDPRSLRVFRAAKFIEKCERDLSTPTPSTAQIFTPKASYLPQARQVW